MRVIDHFDLDLCMNDLYLNVRNLIPSMVITNKEKTEIMYLSFLGWDILVMRKSFQSGNIQEDSFGSR